MDAIIMDDSSFHPVTRPTPPHANVGTAHPNCPVWETGKLSLAKIPSCIKSCYGFHGWTWEASFPLLQGRGERKERERMEGGVGVSLTPSNCARQVSRQWSNPIKYRSNKAAARFPVGAKIIQIHWMRLNANARMLSGGGLGGGCKRQLLMVIAYSSSGILGWQQCYVTCRSE